MPASRISIGLAVGVFDLLHHGHLVFLRSAGLSCGRLLVGLQRDPVAYKPAGIQHSYQPAVVADPVVEIQIERSEQRTKQLERELALLDWVHSELDLIEADLPPDRAITANSNDC